MDTWIFFGGRWKLIANRNYVRLLIFIAALSLLIGSVGGAILGARWGSDVTARAYDLRLAAIDRTVATLEKKIIELQEADESLARILGIPGPRRYPKPRP